MAVWAIWLKRQGTDFFDNPSSRKDFRVQLRGSKTLIQWSIFLLLLLLIGYISYSSVIQFGSDNETTSIESAQSQLRNFYQLMLSLAGGLVSLIAPALGATAVIIDRQRRFLELLLASPMSSRCYLIGKLLSTYRNIWMLLILSLPVVCIGVVLGGETWSNVLLTFLTLSLDGLVFAAIGLALSAGSEKLPATVLSSYVVTWSLIIYASLSGLGAAFRGGIRPGSLELPVTCLLSPFTSSYLITSVTTLFGVSVPNWILFIALSALIVQICLVGGVSAIATKRQSDCLVSNFGSDPGCLVGICHG